MKALSVLISARAMLADPKNWAKGSTFRGHNEDESNDRYCLLGAISVSSGACRVERRTGLDGACFRALIVGEGVLFSATRGAYGTSHGSAPTTREAVRVATKATGYLIRSVAEYRLARIRTGQHKGQYKLVDDNACSATAVSSMNDAWYTDHADILAVLDRAISLARRRRGTKLPVGA